MPPPRRTLSLKGQITTCLLFVALAFIITLAFHPTRTFAEWTVGMPLGVQLAVAATVATLLSLAAVTVLQFPRLRALVPVPEAMTNIDLSGKKPLIVGMCAGVGEELLFRAGLQPLVGLWLGAAIFAAAHVRTAKLGSTSTAKRTVYMLNVALAGVVLGLVFEHLGLLAAVLIHATIDVVGLLVYRTLSTRAATPRSA